MRRAYSATHEQAPSVRHSIPSLWDFQLRLSRRLLGWALPSTAAGLVLAWLGSGLWRGFGIQAAAWGAVDAAIALLGRRSALRSRQREQRETAGSGSAAELRRTEARRLRRILWVNAALDVLYVGGGLALALTLGRSNPAALGHGAGIAVQGLFLLFFGVIHAQAVPPAPPSRPFRSFQDPRHSSFLLPGGRPGALLVHGFPGTPAEMLPLGRLLHEDGWTVQGLLLPGFGAEFPGLLSMPQDRWREAVNAALAALRSDHQPVLLAGYSLGAALAIAAACVDTPDALLLLAPFWRLGSPLQRTAGALLRPFLPQYVRFFAKADFGDPELRQSLGSFFPETDFDDPGFQDELRELTVPLSLLRELDRAGRQAYRAAPRLAVPVLILQGVQDRLARPEHTRRLAARIPGDGSLVELPADHRLLAEASPWWDTLTETASRFARSLMTDGRARSRGEGAP